ncbi:DUF2784 domain-containing protein [Hydrogenophaga sp.]|uniref:DUF2784 domain-containing protein n=1 Tax=Hydrogenophaga sp. TaxID=1904254 RepID=UPI002630E706|nr:DUF2784 domain-containing protein [Hydrogenophaga sp.]MCW5652965.1 DUF2784 domain-containing protein [Hydrogenophaga sp.]
MSLPIHPSPPTAALLADVLLTLHVGIVVFVVGLLPLVLAGGVLGWQWVRRFGLRATHLGLMVFIAVQAWLGQLCPLTVWEQDLRRIAGQAAYGESFIAHWLSRLLYWQAPWWVFVVAYTVFALLVALAWWWVRPTSRGVGRRTAQDTM